MNDVSTARRGAGPRRLPALALLALFALSPCPARGDDAAPDSSASARITALEERLDIVTRELEAIRLGGAADTAVAAASRFGFAPAASKVYGAPPGVSIGGYGEMLLERFDREREDGVPSGRTARLDYLRNVLYVGYKFAEDLLFNSEIELEHAGIGGAVTGEVVLEFAYLDWMPRRELGVRAGMVLVPLGLVNELHEPPVFIGTRRPDVEQRIIPTTWRANGAGVFGEVAGTIAYRAYLTEGLDARRFTAGNALRDGRQSGSRSRATKPAVSGRVDLTRVPGLLLGVSAYTGDSWQEAQPVDTLLTPRVTLFDAHARWQWRGLDVRGVFASGSLDDAGDLSDHLGLAGSGRLGERFSGWYLEGAYDVAPWIAGGASWSLLPYVRHEWSDTQDDVPGGAEHPAHERTTLTAGIGLKPHPNVILKIDRQRRSNPADTETSQWNAQLGYLF